MKCHKMTKLGIVLASMTVLGTLQALPETIVPILGSQVVRAEEPPLLTNPAGENAKFFAVFYYDAETDKSIVPIPVGDEWKYRQPAGDGYLHPGETFTAVAPEEYLGYKYVRGTYSAFDINNLDKIIEFNTPYFNIEYDNMHDNKGEGYGNYVTFYYTKSDPKTPSQDPSDNNNNANTGGGQADGSANGGETTPVTPPTSNEGGTTPAPTQPENGNPGTANPAPEQPNTGNAGTATPGDNANANPPASSDNTSGNQGTEQPAQPEKPEATPETPTQPEKSDTPAAPSTSTPETNPSDGKVEDKPSTGNASANTGDSGKADAVGNSGNADLNTGTTATPNTDSQNPGNTSVRPPANKSDALTTVPPQTTPAPSAIGTVQTLPVTVDYADSKDKMVNPSQPSDTSNPSSIAQPQTLSRVESRHLPKTNDTGSLFAWLGFALVGTGLGLKRRRG